MMHLAVFKNSKTYLIQNKYVAGLAYKLSLSAIFYYFQLLYFLYFKIYPR